MVQSKKSAKKSAPYNYDESAERSLFGDPVAPKPTYYICLEHGRFRANQIKWAKKSPICPTCGKSCSIGE